MEINIKAYAKINLALDIIEEREDSYHNIDTIMEEIDLHDNLFIENGRGGFALTSNNTNLELDENNLVYKAWDALKDRYDGDRSILVHIEKNIPLSAGLAGGSSDCAATIKALNELWSLNLSKEEMADIAKSLGADVPYFIYEGTKRARGIGDILDSIRDFPSHHVILLSNMRGMSSKEVYEDLKVFDRKIDVESLVKYIENDDPLMYKEMKNKMEEITFKRFPELAMMKNDLLNLGAKASLMSGSGPTIFGLFNNLEKAMDAEKRLIDKYPYVLRTKTRNYGQ